jgi:hypothetical protein
MRRYFRTHLLHTFTWFCCRVVRTAACLGLLVICASIAASAQNGQKNSNNASAVLHINVIVVPTVMLPPVKKMNAQDSVITYNVPSAAQNVEMRERTRILSRSGTGSVVLKTTTVVAQ